MYAPDIEFEATIIRSTPKAVLVAPTNDPFNRLWLPKSIIDIVPIDKNRRVYIQMDKQAAIQKGIII